MSCNCLLRFKRYIRMPLLLAMVSAGVATGGPLAYLATACQGVPVSNSFSNPFGVLDVGDGTFSPRGNTPVLVGIGMYNGTLYGVDVFDRLLIIDPSNAAISAVGSIGVNSVAPSPTYGAFDVFAAAVGGLYGLDWDSNLYTVNPQTGAATLVGPTGIPAPSAGFLFGTGMAGDASAFYFNIGEVDPATFNPVIPSSIYRIARATGSSTLLSGIPSLPFFGAGFIDGSIYIGKDRRQRTRAASRDLEIRSDDRGGSVERQIRPGPGRLQCFRDGRRTHTGARLRSAARSSRRGARVKTACPAAQHGTRDTATASSARVTSGSVSGLRPVFGFLCLAGAATQPSVSAGGR